MLFFKKKARIGASLSTAEYELKERLGMDSHPSFYLDVNLIFQQFEEFMTAFDIHESDGMYLAPENRHAVW